MNLRNWNNGNECARFLFQTPTLLGFPSDFIEIKGCASLETTSHEIAFLFAAFVTPGSGGRSALHAACERGDEYLIQLLVRSRADPSTVDSQGSTALDLLRRRGLPDGKILSMFNVTTPNASDGGTGSATDGLWSRGWKSAGCRCSGIVSCVWKNNVRYSCLNRL